MSAIELVVWGDGMDSSVSVILCRKLFKITGLMGSDAVGCYVLGLCL